MKLYATLETSTGKTVSVSDNESITATVYDGNKKAYSVYIEWTTVGDPEHGKCLECGALIERTDECPMCGNLNQNTIEVIPAVMGAIVTTREWRNKTDEKRQAKSTGECVAFRGNGDKCKLAATKGDYCNNHADEIPF